MQVCACIQNVPLCVYSVGIIVNNHYVFWHTSMFYLPFCNHWGWNVPSRRNVWFYFVLWNGGCFCGGHLFLKCIILSEPCSWWDKCSCLCDKTCNFVLMTHNGTSKSVVSAVLAQTFVSIKTGKILYWTGYFCLLFVLEKGFSVFCVSLIACFVASNTQKRSSFQYLALFFRENIRQI